MGSVKRAQGKLLKGGFLPQTQTEDFESWIYVRARCTITFFKDGDRTDVYKVSGPCPDHPEYDEFNSYYTTNLSEAIRIAEIESGSPK